MVMEVRWLWMEVMVVSFAEDKKWRLKFRSVLCCCHQFPLAKPLAAGLTTSLEHHASPANTTNTTTEWIIKCSLFAFQLNQDQSETVIIFCIHNVFSHFMTNIWSDSAMTGKKNYVVDDDDDTSDTDTNDYMLWCSHPPQSQHPPRHAYIHDYLLRSIPSRKNK